MINDLLVRLALRQLMKFLATKLPSWVIGGPLGAMLSFFLEKIISHLVDKTILGMNFLYIDIRTKEQLDKYNKEMDQIAIEMEKGEKTDDEIDDLVIDASRRFFSIG